MSDRANAQPAIVMCAALLVGVAGLAVALAVAGPSSRYWMYCLLSVAMLGAAISAGWLPARFKPTGQTPAVLTFALADLALTAGPALLSGVVDSLEMLLLSGFRGVAAGLIAVRGERAIKLAATVGAFVLIFALALTPEWSRVPLLVVGTAAGTLFLIARHTKAGRIATGPFAVGPTAVLLGGVTLLAGVVALRVPSNHASARGWYAFMPSSGGTVEGSDRARSGVGDGPDEVRGGKDARTSGFDRGEVFVNSDHPGLYDAFVESFGEPVKKSEQLKLIGLKRDQILTSDAHTKQDLRSGRSLQLRRSAPRPPGDGQEQAAGALMLVGGPVPLRMTLAVYDVFDPALGEWVETPVPKQNAALYPNVGASGGAGWMKLVDQPSSPLLGGEVVHEIRLGDIETDVLPLPAFVTAFKLGRVDRADWFAGGPGHVFRLFGRRLPAGSVLDVRSRPADVALKSQDPPVHQASGETLPLDPRLMSLAREWTAGIPQGWDQVNAITSAVRHHGKVGPIETAGVDDAVAEFLFVSRVGQSPQFASATALMLRSLGYQTRLAAGFYADPDKRDRTSGLVRVDRSGAHVWPEVRTASGAWVAIEPTPGFAVDASKMSWQRWLVTWRDAIWSTAHVWISGLVLAVTGFLLRVRLTDWVATVVWRVGLPSDERLAAVSTLRLLELRSRLAGQPRAGGMTLRRFLSTHRGSGQNSGLAEVIEWASYAPPNCPPPLREIRKRCIAAGRELRLTDWMKLASQAPVRSATIKVETL